MLEIKSNNGPLGLPTNWQINGAIPHWPMPNHVNDTKFGECKLQNDRWEIAFPMWKCKLWMAPVAFHH